MEKKKLWIIIGIIVFLLVLFAAAYYYFEIRELPTKCFGGGCTSPPELLIK